MKSLSWFVLLSSISATIVGAIFTVSPVLARAATDSFTNLNEANLAQAKPISPVTGVSALPEENLKTSDPGQVLATTFTVNVEKDTASLQAAQEVSAAVPAKQVIGIYVEGLLDYKVVSQPEEDPAFVSEEADTVTQFSLAAQYGSQGFLAHNTLAGASFFSLEIGQTITLAYGDGSTQNFRIESIKRYQALTPNSIQSDFVDLETGAAVSNSELFYSMYNSDNSVVLLTCIAQDGINTWGRLFVGAVPLS